MGGLTPTDERPDIATADLGRPTVGLLAFEEIGDLDHRVRVGARRSTPSIRLLDRAFPTERRSP
jgi:hypothetical protein